MGRNSTFGNIDGVTQSHSVNMFYENDFSFTLEYSIRSSQYDEYNSTTHIYNMVVNIFGATGLVGGHLLELCLQNPKIDKVKIFVRKLIDVKNPKLVQIATDFAGLEQVKAQISGDIVFNCLGTTLKQAGSQAAQYTVDCEIPVKVAQLAAQNGMPCMVNVSSVGTSPTGNFYLKTKADMEAGVQQAIGKKAYFLRPSFLVGDRKEVRLGEKIGIWSFVVLNHLLIGGSRIYRSIDAQKVAQAMLNIALKQPETPLVYHYDDILAYANQ